MDINRREFVAISAAAVAAASMPGHLIADTVRGPTQSQLGKITGAENDSAALIGLLVEGEGEVSKDQLF